MHRLSLERMRRRPGRAVALAAGILVASTSFTLLTSSVRTSQLVTIGTVQRNARSAYDILVRPPGTRSPLERQAGLVQDNFLSGIYGGITLRQYRDMAALPGVAVAAPVANLGYITALGFIKVSVARYLTSAPFQAFRVTQVYSVGDGQHVFADSPQYVYLTRDPVFTAGSNGLTYEFRTGRRVDTCDYFQVDPDGNPVPLWKFTGAIGSPLGYGKVTSAFDTRLRTSLTCSSTRNRKGASVSDAAATYLNVEMPVQVTAIDPAAEDKLVGLDHAVISGRMLGEHQAAVPYPHGPDAGPGGTNLGLPVLQTSQPYANESIDVQVQRLEPGSPAQLPARLATPQAYKYLTGLPGRTAGSFSVPLSAAYAQAPAQVPSSYLAWFTGPVRYQRRPDGSLSVADLGRQRPGVWASPITGAGFDNSAPVDNTAPQVRRISLLPTTAGAGAVFEPKVVGRFNPALLSGFSALSQVPLETFRSPVAVGADAASRAALRNEPLRPDRNLGGYLQQPPALLTTIAAIPNFINSFEPTPASVRLLAAPISSIMIRVQGVRGIDRLSRARVNAVATAIHSMFPRMALDVTLGSSPQPQTIDLPAGLATRKAVRVTEGWAKIGVGFAIVAAVDRKSAILFVLILVVCGLFLGQATFASVRARRAEIGTLRSLGWSSGEVFASVLAEPAIAGVIAGMAGAGLAALLSWTLRLRSPGWYALAVFPVAVLLAVASGAVPAWRAASIGPLEAIVSPVRRVRRARPVRTLGRLAVRGLTRHPGRTALGAAALALGVAALTILLAVTIAYRGQVDDSLLGAAVLQQARAVDYLSAALALILGVAGAVDVLVISLRERMPELALLRACGWSRRDLWLLTLLEGLGIGVAGGVAGAAAGIGVVAGLGAGIPARAIAVAIGTAALGALLVTLAAAAPVTRLTRVAPVAVLTVE